MRKQRSGVILNVSSIFGKRGMPFETAYCASKFARRLAPDAAGRAGDDRGRAAQFSDHFLNPPALFWVLGVTAHSIPENPRLSSIYLALAK
jgi:hypothetical protein